MNKKITLFLLIILLCGCNKAVDNNSKLNSVLNYSDTFITENGKEELLSKIEYKPKEYIFIDLNKDYNDELVIKTNDNKIIVLHLFNNDVYGFEFDSKEFNSVNEDGLYKRYINDIDYDIMEIHFNQKEIILQIVAEYHETNGVYTLDGDVVSKNIVEEYINSLNEQIEFIQY